MITDLTVELHTSTPLTDLFESKKLVLDDAFQSRLSASCTLARRLVAKIIEEVFQTTEEVKRQGEMDQTERRRAHEAALLRDYLAELRKVYEEEAPRPEEQLGAEATTHGAAKTQSVLAVGKGRTACGGRHGTGSTRRGRGAAEWTPSEGHLAEAGATAEVDMHQL